MKMMKMMKMMISLKDDQYSEIYLIMKKMRLIFGLEPEMKFLINLFIEKDKP